MPIRFRCDRCNRLLGIARRKAGAETTCPHCAGVIRVPMPKDGQTDMEEIDELLNPVAAVAPSATPDSFSAPEVAPRPAAPPVPRPMPNALLLPSSEQPLFERDLDAVLGMTHPAPDTNGRRSQSNPTSGMDAMSIAPEVGGHVVLSPQKATVLVIAVVVLLALAFVAGFLIASR